MSMTPLFVFTCCLFMVDGHYWSEQHHIGGTYEFDMDFGEITRNMRVYICLFDGKVFMSITDYKPVNGFDEFTIGLAVFGRDCMTVNDRDNITAKGIIIGDSQLFVDAQYVLYLNTNINTIKSVTYKYEYKHQWIKKQYELQRVKERDLSKDDLMEKCWIPYDIENIQHVIANGKSIWKTHKLLGLNVYDMDILNENGDNRGCWGWVNKEGIEMEADNIGTAGGDNYNYEYKFNGDLLILQWNDYGSWIKEEQSRCHQGTSIFMIIDEHKALATFTCSDGITGSQMIMYKKPFLHTLRCPLVRKVEEKKEL